MSVLLNPYTQFDRFTEKREEDLYPEPLKEEMRLVSVEPNKLPTIFGSYKLRIQKYPADIDLKQHYDKCCSRQAVINSFAQRFQKIVANVEKKRMHYYSETKIGLDPIYAKIALGDFTAGIYTPYKDLSKVVEALYRKKLIEAHDYELVTGILRDHSLDADDYDIVDYVLRKYRILRWTAKEVLAGKKKLIGNRTITLKEALGYNTLLKIDVITSFNDNITEITNAFHLSYPAESPDGEELLIEINADTDLHKELPKEIEKLYFSNMWYSPFKMVKRMYALAKASVRDYRFRDVARKLFPFISSNTSQLYQMKGQLDSALIIIQRSKSAPVGMIRNQLMKIRNALDTIIEIPNENLKIYDKLIDAAIQYRSAKFMEAPIKDLVSMLKKKINYGTIAYLKTVGLNPPPEFMLPPHESYDWSKVREVNANPENPLYRYDDKEGEGCEFCGGFDFGLSTN